MAAPPPYFQAPPNAAYGSGFGQQPPPQPPYGQQAPQYGQSVPPVDPQYGNQSGYGADFGKGNYPNAPSGYPSAPTGYPNAPTGYPNAPPPERRNSRGEDVEAGGEVGFVAKDFSNINVRQAFIRKVYFTLTVQLSITFGVVALFIFCKPVKEFIQENSYLYFFGYAIFMVTYIMLVCCKSVRRKFPQNVIMLFIFTLALSYMVGTISSYYDTNIVFMAIGITAGITLSVSIFACQTKIDFTRWIGVLFVISMGFFVFGIFTIFFYSSIMNLIYSAIGAVLFTVFLAVDTQLIIGGKRHEISPEDHILGSIMLYIDIVYIFLFVMSLLNGSNR